MPDSVSLIKTDERAEYIHHYIDEDSCKEEGFVIPETLKELTSLADLEGFDVDDILVLDDSMGGDYPSDFSGGFEELEELFEYLKNPENFDND